jgi:AraC-like DNA-binding protein
MARRRKVPQDTPREIGLPGTHAVLAQVATWTFSEVGVSAALMDGETWFPLYKVADVIPFEFALGVERRRWTYNDRSIARARREKGPVLGRHAGFHDFFVPVRNNAGPSGMIITGPFSLTRPNASEILARWRSISGRQGRSTDPEFLLYAGMTLATATFEGQELHCFERLLSCLAGLLQGDPNPARLGDEANALRERLRDVRFVERMWQAAHELVDERTTRQWMTAAKDREFWLMGLKKLPQYAVVGLSVSRNRDADPLENLIQRDAFARACVAHFRKRGGVLCGRVGDYGVALLLDDAGSPHRVQHKLTELGNQARSLARKFGFELHVGLGPTTDRNFLPHRYQGALEAAERAVSEGRSMLQAEVAYARRAHPLREVRRKLGQGIVVDPRLLKPKFDRYLDAVAAHSGYRLEPVRAHLEAGFDVVDDALRSAAALDERSLVELELGLKRAADESNTVEEMAAAYRRAMTDVELALTRPTRGRHERSLRRATDYIRDHLTEPLSLDQVARAAGFARAYFSRMFKKSEGVSFQEYVGRLRIEQGKQLLESTTLGIEQVGKLSGFRTRSLFHAAFRRALGVTPSEYRERTHRTLEAFNRK